MERVRDTEREIERENDATERDRKIKINRGKED